MLGKVVTFGEIMLRLKAPYGERLLQSNCFEASFGGGEANVAVSLASFGEAVRYVTLLPDNEIGQACIRQLNSFGVNTEYIVRNSSRIGVYYVEPGSNQRPSKVIYDRTYSAISLVRPGDIDWEKVFMDADWFHFTGITPAISQNAADEIMTALTIAKKRGITVSCDLNYRGKLWRYGKTPKEVMRDIFSFVDIGIGNEEDYQKMLDIDCDWEVRGGALNIEDYKHMSEKALLKYPSLKIAAVTLRESYNANDNDWSACLNDRKSFIISKKYRISHIVDRVGSGDAFAGGFIYGLRNLRSHRDALEFAVAAGCLKHSILGDYNRCSVQEVIALMEGGGSGRVQR